MTIKASRDITASEEFPGIKLRKKSIEIRNICFYHMFHYIVLILKWVPAIR